MHAKETIVRKKRLLRESSRFILVGVLSTLLNYAVNMLGMYNGASPEFASACGYVAGVALGFPLNKYWSFAGGASPSVRSETVRYFLVYLGTFLLNSLLAAAFFEQALKFEDYPILELLYYIPVIGVTTVLNFFGCKFLVFKT